MNDILNLVARKWYRIYWTVMMFYSVSIVGGYFATTQIDGLERYAATFGLGGTALSLALLHIGYSTTLYWVIRMKQEPFALLISSMLLVVLQLQGLANSEGWGLAIFIAYWAATALFVGMYGLSLTLGSMLLANIFTLHVANFNILDTPWQYAVFLLCSLTFTPAGYWLYWRKHFINPQEIKISKLSEVLRTKQEQSILIIQSLIDGVIVVDTNNKVNLINTAAAHFTGWKVQDAIGVDARLVVKLARENGEPLPEGENPFTTIFAQKKSIRENLQITDQKGKSRIISFVISPVMSGAEQDQVAGAVAVIRDISVERAAEQQRAEFISTASHEMRTPVAAIEGYLALALNDKVSTIDSRGRKYLEKAHSSTQHLGKLFQDLLTSAKAEDGRLSSHPTVMEVGGFLEQLVDDLKLAAQKKNLITEFVVGENRTIDATANAEASLKVVKPLYYTYADPERIREVVTNLFDNAVKYTEQGKISIGLTGNNEVVQIYIRDTGIGIPAEDIPHMFQKFYRVDNSATRVIGGTGLGLFIARKIIELYSGRIWVESELGKGSTFYINLPRLSTQRAEQFKAAEATGATPQPMQQPQS